MWNTQMHLQVVGVTFAGAFGIHQIVGVLHCITRVMGLLIKPIWHDVICSPTGKMIKSSKKVNIKTKSILNLSDVSNVCLYWRDAIDE